MNNIIKKNYFIIDSNNLNDVESHMYGFSVSKKGILTDNYYKHLGKYEEPEPQGTFVMIRKFKNKIIINQDFYGSFGIYIYENKKMNYFALSNSFLLLEEYLMEKQSISLNKDFADNLVISSLCSFSMEETLINEINQIPTNVFISINIKNKILKKYFIDYKEGSIPLESEEGVEVIDNWINKWGYILRSLKKKTNNISSDLSGGFDTRTLLALLLNTGINLNDININSIQDNVHDHMSDFQIAKNISTKFGFKLNNYNLNRDGVLWNIEDMLNNSLYSKLGFHKELYINDKYYKKPLFIISGNNGEALRGTPNLQINEFIKDRSSNNIPYHEFEFYNSSVRLLKRSISFLKRQREFTNDYEISSSLYDKCIGKYHFGKLSLERFTANIFTIQPLMDPDIKKIRFKISSESTHDLIAFIYVRFAHDLIYFPFQGKRILNLKSIKKAENLNKRYKQFFAESGYNKNFYIDNERKSPVPPSKYENNANEFLKELFKSSQYINILNKKYDKYVYNWANIYSNISDYYPLRHHYALLAIAVTLENIGLNKKFFKNSTEKNCLKNSTIINI